MTITHAFVSAIPDDADTSLVRPSNWNADHVVSGTAGSVFFSDGAGGLAQDNANLSFDNANDRLFAFRLWGRKVQAGGSAAITAISRDLAVYNTDDDYASGTIVPKVSSTNAFAGGVFNFVIISPTNVDSDFYSLGFETNDAADPTASYFFLYNPDSAPVFFYNHNTEHTGIGVGAAGSFGPTGVLHVQGASTTSKTLIAQAVASQSSSVFEAQTSAAGLLVAIAPDGRLYGSALHNNAGAVTGVTNQYLASGTYTPTLTNGTNVSASTAYQAQWLRVGNVVTVSGRFDVDTVAATTGAILRISLPIASNFAANEDCAGTANADGVVSESAAIYADATNNDAQVAWITTTTINHGMSFTFTYEVLA